jgi:hypothetical protein
MTDFTDDERLLALHPWVREAIRNNERDKPLTLNWSLRNRKPSRALDCPT